MASRRQKFKPLAGIQNARRTLKNTVSETITKKLSEDDLNVLVKIEDNQHELMPLAEVNCIESNVHEIKIEDVPSKCCDTSEKVDEKPPINVPPKPFRRSIKPAVVIPDRRRKLIQATQVKAEKTGEQQPVSENVEKIIQIEITSPTPLAPLTPLTLKQENSDNIQKPLTPDETFKSPFLSPPIQTAQKRPEFPYNPLDQHNGESAEDPSKSPASKVRQRIRPTPFFGRRNSVQGGISESEDESNKRQRHLSTSSSHSSYNVSNIVTQKAAAAESSRIRTDSVCSNISESMFQPYSKPKRIARSEEFQKIATAKKEFNQRFNGKTPEKHRLTMYDMIYYNPITNPLKNPAPKSNEIKERRSSTASSVQSVVPTRSIKIEAKTLDDSVEAEMPVPQLKLGPNGEIVLDEKSLVIETTGDKEARETLANAEIVYDDEFNSCTGFYKRQKRTREWDANETIKFYRCLHSVGTDFSLMLMLFPNRTRRDLKLKFKKEEKTNLNLINKALLHPKEFNIDDLKVELEKEEKELEQKKLEWEELKQKHAKEKREQTKLLRQKSRCKRTSTAARNLAGGELIYEYQFATASRKNRKKGAYVTKVDSANNDSVPSTDNILSKPPTTAKPPRISVKKEYRLPDYEVPKCPDVPVSSQDILNMDIIFENVVETEGSGSLGAPLHVDVISTQNIEKSIPQHEEIHEDVNEMFEASQSHKIKEEMEFDGGVEENTMELDDEDIDANDESKETFSKNELAVVASHSVDDPNNVIYEVYAVSPITRKITGKPLDIPPEVVEQLRISFNV